MESWFITYTENLAGFGNAMILVRSDGNSDVILDQDPYGLPFEGRSEIGTFQHRLHHEQIQTLTPLLESASTEAPSETLETEPGTPTVTFGMGTGETLGDLSCFALNVELPPKTGEFRNAILKLASEVVQYPQKTVKASADWLVGDRTIHDDTLSLDLRLQNSGMVPITIANPAASPNDDAVGLTLLLNRELPSEKLTSRDAGAIEILAREVSVIPDEKANEVQPDEPEPLVTLHPDQVLELRIETRQHLYMTPGTYVGQITLNMAPGDIPEEETVIGRLSTQIGSFTVRREN